MKNSSLSAFDPLDKGFAQHLFQDSVDAVILTDRAGTVVKANERTFDFLGYDRAELVGRKVNSLYLPEQLLPDFSALPAGSSRLFDGVMPDQAKQELFFVQVHATYYKIDGTDIVQWILHDITRQIELEQMRQDLAATLVHDLQGPLGNILSSLELARNDLPAEGDETVRSMLDIAFRSSQHLEALVASLTDISHLEAGHPITDRAALDANDLIDYVYEVEESDLRQRRITPQRAVDPDVPQIVANESMLRRVLLNLLDNSLKYSQQGQTITIAAQPAKDISLVRFSVIDQGQGVPESYRELIFDKFQRVRISSSSSGLGLGLAFCRLAIEAHGGRIWVEDAPAGGACFSFTVPAASDSAPESTGNLHN